MSKQINYLMKLETKQNDDTASVSSSDDDTPEWRKGLNETQAMYIATAYRADNDLSYDKSIHHINPDDVSKYRKQFKKAKRSF